MATPWQIRIPASDTGLLRWKQTGEAAAKVSELLQKDLEVCVNSRNSWLNGV